MSGAIVALEPLDVGNDLVWSGSGLKARSESSFAKKELAKIRSIMKYCLRRIPASALSATLKNAVQ
jgi:hypothetical protein